MPNFNTITRWIFSHGDAVDAATLLVFGSPHHTFQLAVKAVEVWHAQGLRHIIISGYNGEAEKLGAAIHRLGVPLAGIHLETQASNTLENITNSRTLIERFCPTPSIHLLMKRYASPRVLNTFKSVFPDWKARVHHLDLHEVDQSNWMHHDSFKLKVFAELQKIITYYNKGDIKLAPEFIGQLLKMDSWLNAQRLTRPTAATPFNASPIECNVIRRNEMTVGDLRLVTLHAHLNAEGASTEFTSSIIERPDAVSVVCYDPADDTLVMVRQFRVPHFLATGRHSTLEIIAGYIDSGETPREAALRELKEETGLTPQRLFPLLSYYPAPTLSTETMHLWCAIVTSSAKAPLLMREGELISTDSLTFSELSGHIANGGVTDALTLIAITALNELRPFLISHD